MSEQDISVRQLDALCEELAELHKGKEVLAGDLKKVNKAISELEGKILGHLDNFEKEEYSGSWGRIVIKKDPYYRMNDRDAAEKWLKETGHWDSLASVNAARFSSFCKEQVQQRQEQHMDFNWMPPGVDGPSSTRRTLKLK